MWFWLCVAFAGDLWIELAHTESDDTVVKVKWPANQILAGDVDWKETVDGSEIDLVERARALSTPGATSVRVKEGYELTLRMVPTANEKDLTKELVLNMSFGGEPSDIVIPYAEATAASLSVLQQLAKVSYDDAFSFDAVRLEQLRRSAPVVLMSATDAQGEKGTTLRTR